MYLCKKIKSKKMSNYVVSINERMTAGKVFLDYLKSLSRTSNYVDIAVYEKEEDSYDPEFVAKIKRSMSSEGRSIKTEDLWK